MQNVIKNRTKKLLKNYYLSQVYLFISFYFWKKRIKNYLTIRNMNIRSVRKYQILILLDDYSLKIIFFNIYI